MERLKELVITTTDLPPGRVGQPFSATLAAKPAVMVGWTVEPALPAGLRLESGSGMISGVPSDVFIGTPKFTARADGFSPAHKPLLLVIRSGEDMPIGAISAYAGPITTESRASLKKSGWLPCDGTTVSRAEYEGLFEVIGIDYGTGDGVNTFNLPDFRGRFLRGTDAGAQVDPDAGSRTGQVNAGSGPGKATGDHVGSVQADTFGAHSHTFSKFPSEGTKDIAGGTYWGQARASTDPSGGAETRPRNSYTNYLIRFLP